MRYIDVEYKIINTMKIIRLIVNVLFLIIARPVRASLWMDIMSALKL